MYCKKCGAQLHDNERFCSACGNKVEVTVVEHSKKIDANPARRYKVVSAILSVLLVLAVAIIVINPAFLVPTNNQGASNSEQATPGEYDQKIEPAVTALTQKWAKLYSKDENCDGYLEIYHTRFIDVTPDEENDFFQILDKGMDIDYIVEFSLYSDYFSASPYYYDIGAYNSVVVYTDGSTSVEDNVFKLYSNRTYNYDYSDFIEEIIDLGAQYNRILDLK